MSARRYRFFVHRRHPAFRLVVREDRAFPPDGREADWESTRVREAGDVNEQVRAEVDARGFSLFKLGFDFSEIPDD
jgi:hypothetical protein